MKQSLLFLLVGILLMSCEDKKKVVELKVDSSEEKNIVSDSIKEKEIIPVEEEEITFEYLTNENVASFLTEYGKENPEQNISLITNHGTIDLVLYNDTPLHRANFIYLLKNGYWDTTFFHRVVDGFIVQAGNSDRRATSTMRSKIGKYTIPAEIKYGHNRGALAAAKEYRANPDDRSSAYEFYIVQSHNGANHLNPNYTVFGRVTSGMDVVDKIAKLETDGNEWPYSNVFIEAIIKD